MRSQCVPVFLIDFGAEPEEGEDENTGDDALVKEVVGIYLSVPYTDRPV